MSAPAGPRRYRWLALLPGVGMLAGVPFANRTQPYIFGLPPLLAWIVGWVLMTSVIMGAIWTLDSRRDRQDAQRP